MHACHDEMRDVLRTLLERVYKDVAMELHLPPLTGEQLPSSIIAGDASLDFCERRFWVREQRASIDVRAFNPFVLRHLTNLNTALLPKKERNREGTTEESYKVTMVPLNH